MAKRRKKRVFKVKNIIILLMVLIFLGGIFWYGLSMPVQNIYISGNYVVSDNEILSLSGLDEYPSFLLTTRFKIKKSILSNKYISDVIVKKKLGNVLELEIVEYGIVASNIDGKVILDDGTLIENVYNINDIPRLISHLDNKRMVEFANKFSGIEDNILREISEIEYSPIEVDEDRFLLYMDDGNLVYVTLTKIGKVNKYNDIKDELMGRKGIIYLDSGDYVELKG